MTRIIGTDFRSRHDIGPKLTVIVFGLLMLPEPENVRKGA